MSRAGTLAQEAMDIYDELGEDAMARYIYHTRPEHDDHGLWSHGAELLGDGSVAVRMAGPEHPAEYRFV